MWSDVDVERAFPSVIWVLALLLYLLIGVPLALVNARARLWGIAEWCAETGVARIVDEWAPKGLLALRGTHHRIVRWGRGAMEGSINGPFDWLVLSLLIALCLFHELKGVIRHLTIVADDMKIEHGPEHVTRVVEATIAILCMLRLQAAGDKWNFWYLVPPKVPPGIPCPEIEFVQVNVLFCRRVGKASAGLRV